MAFAIDFELFTKSLLPYLTLVLNPGVDNLFRRVALYYSIHRTVDYKRLLVSIGI